MMKQKLLIPLLSVLLCSLNSFAGLTLVSIDSGPNLKLVDFWSEMIQKFNLVEKDVIVSIKNFSELPKHQINAHGLNLAGMTLGSDIYLRTDLAEDDRESVLRHELAHVFLNSYCSDRVDLNIHEFYAHWISGDYQRVLQGQNEVVLKAQALKILNLETPEPRIQSLALSRMIFELMQKQRDQLIKDWFFKFFRTCERERGDFSQLMSQVKTSLDQKGQDFTLSKKTKDNLKKNSLTSSQEEGFLVFDGLAHEVLEFEGAWADDLSVGSILKPLGVAFFKDFKKPRKSQKEDLWLCENIPTVKIRQWSWNEALPKSCNGFFIDAQLKEEEKKSYSFFLKSLGVKEFSEKYLSPADVIGLWPTLKINLKQVAQFYSYLIETQPEVMSVLKNTAGIGTLSGLPDSPWFIKNGIALKSGTVTGLDLSVERGYIVGAFDLKQSPKIVVYFKAGKAPKDLLPLLKEKIRPYLELHDDKSSVQILSRVPAQQIEVKCSTITMILDSKKEIVFSKEKLLMSELDKNKIYSCLGEPFTLRFPDQKSGFVEKNYYGKISASPKTTAPPSSGYENLETNENMKAKTISLREKNARARTGSQFMLETSLSHYLNNVRLSEIPTGKKESTKALGLVFKNNVFLANKKGPICDTTLCQIYNLNYDDFSQQKKQEGRLWFREVQNVRLFSKDKIEFSVGGDEKWVKEIGLKEFSNALGFPGLVSKIERNESVSNPTTFYVQSMEKNKTYLCDEIQYDLKLQSCPTAIQFFNDSVKMMGVGEGHGRGIDWKKAESLAQQGFRYNEILDFFLKDSGNSELLPEIPQ